MQYFKLGQVDLDFIRHYTLYVLSLFGISIYLLKSGIMPFSANHFILLVWKN